MEEIREVMDRIFGGRPITDFYGVTFEIPDEDLAFINNQYGKILLIINNHAILNQTVFAKDIDDGLEILDDKGAFFEFQIENDAVTVNGVNIVATDFESANGVIHIVDGVLLSTEGEFLPSRPSECIICNIVLDPNFEVILNLVNLLFVENWCQINPDTCLLSIYGENYTFFPPVNSALTAVIGPDPAAFVEAVGPEFLNTIMTNHWVEGSFASSDLADGQELTSLAGFPLQISLGEQGAFVNDQQILALDFFTSEGVYHPIGGVLLPPIPPQPPQ
jgi:uncharacterized surface protein with fasciclin (FAS1) repeats